MMEGVLVAEHPPMRWYAVVFKKTGMLESAGAVLQEVEDEWLARIPADREAIVIEEPPNGSKWDAVTRSFVAPNFF